MTHPNIYCIRFLVLPLVAFTLLSLFPVRGQEASGPSCDTMRLQVYFPQGVSRIQPSFRDNRYQMEVFPARLKGLQDSGAAIQSLIVKTAASPEGSTLRNRELAEQRAGSIKDWLLEEAGVDSGLVTVIPVGEDWAGLAARIRTLDQPWRDEALSIILNTPEWVTRDGVVVDSRKKRLMTYQGGQVWNYLEEWVFPELRQAGGQVSCIYQTAPVATVSSVRDTVRIYETITVRDTVFMDRMPSQALPARQTAHSLEGWQPVIALRTNILAIPLANVGLEIPMGRKFSLGVDWYYPWIPRDNAHMNCNQLLAADLELRYWFTGGSPSADKKLTRHAVGIYGAAGYYDFERSGSGHQGEFFNVGVEYVYGLPIFRNRLRLEFELGLGYIYSVARPYDCFVAGEKCFRRPGVKDYIRWWGPTRAQVSVVVPIYGKIKKGGER